MLVYEWVYLVVYDFLCLMVVFVLLVVMFWNLFLWW